MTNLSFYAEQIVRGAKVGNLRTGQYLFNHLPREVGGVVAGTLFDPFHDDLSKHEIQKWLDNHLIFDHGIIVGVFNGNQLLWEAKGE